MADLIDRKKIKARFEPWLKVQGYSEGELNMLKAVLYEITIMPSAQPDVPDTNVGDMINRQAAIDAAFDIFPDDEYFREQFVKSIEALPSAQPEIIRCRDCKHRHLDGMIWNCPFGLSGGADFFCAYGAKMEVEHDSNIHAE